MSYTNLGCKVNSLTARSFGECVDIVEKNIKIPLLLDFYGDLLSETQRDYIDYYYNKDLSLSEISDNVGKSRQGILECIKRAESVLVNADEKLKLLDKERNLKNDLCCLKVILENLRYELVSKYGTNFEKIFNDVFSILDKYND